MIVVKILNCFNYEVLQEIQASFQTNKNKYFSVKNHPKNNVIMFLQLSTWNGFSIESDVDQVGCYSHRCEHHFHHSRVRHAPVKVQEGTNKRNNNKEV